MRSVPQPSAGPHPRRHRDRRRRLAIASALALVALVVISLRISEGPEVVRAPDIAGPNASLRPVDGGPSYYAQFPRSLPSDRRYFPIGVWFESVLSQAEVDKDKAAGLNLYVALTANSDLPLIARNGMKVIAQQEDWLDRADAPGSEAIAGWLLDDEPDMRLPPRKAFARLRSLARKLPTDDGRLNYTGYGKGVTFWNTDAHAARYVSEFQDVVAADNYWFTDKNICIPSEGGQLISSGGRPLPPSRCHRAANYGRTVARVRRLVRPAGSRPVWVIVEVGHPFSDSSWPSIEPAQISAAVWSGIIHGARGVLYFNHSFGGPAPTQHALREPAYARVRAEVARTNGRIRRLAAVLNSPFVERFASTTAAVDTMTKRFEGRFYIFAGSRASATQRASFRVPCAGESSVTVVDENRTLRLTGGAFEDSFTDGNAVHIYRIENESACWVPGG